MINSKAGFKIAILSALFVAGSIIPAAQADHNSQSILPYVALGVFASILHNSSHSQTYRYKKKRYSGHSGYGHGGQGGHYGHGGGHYGSHYQHSHSSGGYRYKSRKH